MTTDDINMDIVTVTNNGSPDGKERKKKIKKDKKSKKRKRDNCSTEMTNPNDLSPTHHGIPDPTASTHPNDATDSEETKGKVQKKEKKKHKKKHDSITVGNVGDGDITDDHENREVIMKRHQEVETRAIVGDFISKTTTASLPGRAVVESSAIEYYDPAILQNPELRDGADSHSLSNDNLNKARRKYDYSLTLLLFYQYVEPAWDESTYENMLKTLQKVGVDLELTGRMRVAREGLNCTLTASYSSILEYCNILRQLRPKEFQNTEFKLTRDLPVAQKFPNLKVFKVVELVHYGLEGAKAPPISKYHGTHLEPREYHQKLAEPNTVIIDVVSVSKSVANGGVLYYIFVLLL
jgi:hypothetical protein